MHNCAYSRPLGPARRWRSGKLGKVLRHLLDLLLPVDCGGCGAPGAALCPDCAALLGVPSQVYPACCPTGPPVYALGNYHGRLRTAILAYKERGRRDLANPLGAALAAALLQIRSLHPDCGSGTVWMVPAPSRNAAAGRRGGQHVALLARRAAAALAGAGVAAAVAPALRLGAGVRDSVGLSAAARRANLAGRVLARRAGLPPAGTTVVLVDDVVTTGATASACVAALVQTGVGVSAILALAAAGGHSPS